MQIVEYKKHKTREGSLVDPEWLKFVGFFYNSDDKTYIGVIDDEADREHYVPDSVIVLTKEQLIARYNGLSEEDKQNSISTPEAWYDQFILGIKETPAQA